MFVLRNGPDGVAEAFFFGGKKFLEPVFVDRLHKRFMRRNDAFWNSAQIASN